MLQQKIKISVFLILLEVSEHSTILATWDYHIHDPFTPPNVLLVLQMSGSTSVGNWTFKSLISYSLHLPDGIFQFSLWMRALTQLVLSDFFYLLTVVFFFSLHLLLPLLALGFFCLFKYVHSWWRLVCIIKTSTESDCIPLNIETADHMCFRN